MLGWGPEDGVEKGSGFCAPLQGSALPQWTSVDLDLKPQACSPLIFGKSLPSAGQLEENMVAKCGLREVGTSGTQVIESPLTGGACTVLPQQLWEGVGQGE